MDIQRFRCCRRLLLGLTFIPPFTNRICVYISNGNELKIPRNTKQPEANVTIFMLRWRSKIICIRQYVWHAKNCARKHSSDAYEVL